MRTLFSSERLRTVLWTAVVTSAFWVIGYLAFAPECIVSCTKREGMFSFYTIYSYPDDPAAFVIEESEGDHRGNRRELFRYRLTGTETRHFAVGIKHE